MTIDDTKVKSPDPTQGMLEKRRRELWIYMAVSIVAVEILILVGALGFGFLSSYSAGAKYFSFPWLSWGALSLVIPAIILLAVHSAGVGLFRSASKDKDAEWEKHLPEKLQKAYRIISRAPAVVLLGGIVIVGVAALTLDGAITAIEAFLLIFKPYLLHILAGIGIILVIFGLAAVWLNYRTRRLYAEYEYRKDVLEKTGIVIVDKKSLALQPGEGSYAGYAAIEGTKPKALPATETIIDVEDNQE